MAEYIEREPLLAEYDREHTGSPGRARELIANAPAADVAPVRHGRWKQPNDELLCWCSKCGINAPHHTANGEIIVWPILNYCPNCGAKMDGDIND